MTPPSPKTDPAPDTDADAPPVRDPADEEGAASGRRWVRAFIVVAVTLQLLVPLTYYLRDDPYDERFSWRMFSGVRLQECEASAYDTRPEGERQVNLYRVIPPGWIANLQRDRQPVIERYLEHRCAAPGVERVRVVNACRGVDGQTLPPREYARDCAAGETP